VSLRYYFFYKLFSERPLHEAVTHNRPNVTRFPPAPPVFAIGQQVVTQTLAPGELKKPFKEGADERILIMTGIVELTVGVVLGLVVRGNVGRIANDGVVLLHENTALASLAGVVGCRLSVVGGRLSAIRS
jgi:hypothetical protein